MKPRAAFMQAGQGTPIGLAPMRPHQHQASRGIPTGDAWLGTFERTVGRLESTSAPPTDTTRRLPRPTPPACRLAQGAPPLLLRDGTREELCAALAVRLGLTAADLELEPATSGHAPSATVFFVKHQGARLAVFKIFARPSDCDDEVAGMRALEGLRSLRPTQLFGTVDLSQGGATQRGLLMEHVPYRSIGHRLVLLPAAPAARTAARKQCEHELHRLAGALAELHTHYDAGELVSPTCLAAWCDYVAHKLAATRQGRPEHAATLDKLGARLAATVFPRVRAARVRRTVVHGDANLRNFMVESGGIVRTYDVQTVAHVLDRRNDWAASAALDVGRVLQHLAMTPHGLGGWAAHGEEVRCLQHAFLRAYVSAPDAPRLNDATVLLARIEFELAVLHHAPTDALALSAVQRLDDLEAAASGRRTT